MLEIFKYNAIRDMFKLNISAKELETIFKDYKKNKSISPKLLKLFLTNWN